MRTTVQPRYTATMVAVGLLVSSCAATDDTREVDSLGSAAAAIACAEHVFWGAVESTSVEPDGLHVTFRVNEWVRPELSDAQITLVADDPAENVAAPAWDTSERVLVVDGQDSPLEAVDDGTGRDMVVAWEQAGSPTSCSDGP